MLFWFDVAYVCLRNIHKAIQKYSSRKAAAAVSATTSTCGDDLVVDVNSLAGTVAGAQVPVQASGNAAEPCCEGAAETQQYSVKAVLLGLAVVILAFTATSFGALMATYGSPLVGCNTLAAAAVAARSCCSGGIQSICCVSLLATAPC
jgi:hypothetical protein